MLGPRAVELPPVRLAFRCALALLCLLPAAATAQEGALLSGSPRPGRQLLFERADLAGRLFFDADGDGRPGPGEPGIRGAVVALASGLYTVTDGRGRYHLRDLLPGQALVVVDAASLPAGAVAPAPSVLELPPGGLVVLDLPVAARLTRETIGREQETGYKVFPKLTELPISVAGNTADFKVLANGVAVALPRVELELSGLSRGELAAPGSAITLRPRLVGGAGKSSAFRWEVITPDGTRVAAGEGEGPLPGRIPWDGRTGSGSPAPADAAYAARLCVELAGGESACSPYRLFGITGPAGQRPRLQQPPLEPFAVVGGAPAPVDPDGSFLKGAAPGPDRALRVELHGADGRVAGGQLRFPALTLAPTSPFPVRFGAGGDGTRVDPADPEQLLVTFTGKATPDARAARGNGDELPLREGSFGVELPIARGKNRAELALLGDGGVTTLYELSLLVANRTPAGEPIVTVAGVPSLSVEAPPAGAPLGPARQCLLRGAAEPGSVVSVGGREVAVAPDGSFAVVAPVGPDGAVSVEVTDPRRGYSGELRRRLRPATGGLAATGFGDLTPGLRAPLSSESGEAAAVLLGGGQASGRSLGEGLRASAGIGASPLAPRGLLADGLVALELPAGRFAVGLRARTALLRDLDGAAPGAAQPGTEQGLLIEATAFGSLRGESFLAFVDAELAQTGLEHLDRPEGDAGRVFERRLAGAGAGATLALGPALELALRLGAGAALGAPAAPPRADRLPFPERLDGYAALLFRPGPGQPALLARYSLAREQGSFEPDAGEAGAEAEHVLGTSLDLPLGRATLREGLAVRLAGRGEGELVTTPYNLTRLELRLTDSLLAAADYRLLLVPEAPVHHLAAEADLLLAPGVRLGAVVEGTGGPAFPEELRAFLRLQGFFDSGR